jgi:hypothetical protein
VFTWFTLNTSPEDSQEAAVTVSQPDNGAPIPAAETRATVPANATPVPETSAVEYSEEKPILGQFMRVLEIRENNNGNGDGPIRNMEFVFREGILPQMLFPGNGQVILKYDQLARNIVGFGAATAFFYYEIVTHDTNGDGIFSDLDAITVAISRPTGAEYRVLASNVEAVLAYEDLPEDEALRLILRIGGKEVTRVYSLSGRNNSR